MIETDGPAGKTRGPTRGLGLCDCRLWLSCHSTSYEALSLLSSRNHANWRLRLRAYLLLLPPACPLVSRFCETFMRFTCRLMKQFIANAEHVRA